MMQYGLKKSFGIDHGELDGLTVQKVFCLGYELATVDMRADEPEGWEQYVHVENKQRVERSLGDAGRKFTLRFMDGDVSESWLWLKVKPTVSTSGGGE